MRPKHRQVKISSTGDVILSNRWMTNLDGLYFVEGKFAKKRYALRDVTLRDFCANDNFLTSMRGLPRSARNVRLAKNRIVDFVDGPQRINFLSIVDNGLTSLAGINRLGEVKNIDVTENSIEESILGLLLVKGLTGVSCSMMDAVLWFATPGSWAQHVFNQGAVVQPYQHRLRTIVDELEEHDEKSKKESLNRAMMILRKYLKGGDRYADGSRARVLACQNELLDVGLDALAKM